MDTTTNESLVASSAGFNPLAIDDDEVRDTLVAKPASPATSPEAVPEPEQAPAEVVAPTSTEAAPAAERQADPATTDTAESGVEEVDTAAVARQAEIVRYARRRRLYTWAVIGVAAAGLWMVKPWTSLSTGASTNTAASDQAIHHTNQAARPAGDLVAADMTVVHAKLASTGDLTGLTLPGADVAAAGTTLYAARVTNDGCVVYGVVDGKDLVPAADTTGAACHGQIATVQTQLDAAERQRRTAANDQANAALAKAADTAGFYGQRNMTAGSPSLAGLPADALDGVTVVANHGSYATLRATAAGICRTAIVAASGQLGEISPC